MINTKDPAWAPIQMEKRGLYFPVVQCKLRILAKKGIGGRQSFWQGISILVGNLLAEIHGRQEVEGCGYHPSNT